MEDKKLEAENDESEHEKTRKRRRVSSKVPEEDGDDASDDEFIKSRKRRSYKVPTECTLCKRTYCSKSSYNQHMQVWRSEMRCFLLGRIKQFILNSKFMHSTH